jgi:hypothetical protein
MIYKDFYCLVYIIERVMARFIKEKLLIILIKLKGGIRMPKGKNVLGAWAFLIGVILAVVIGILGVDVSTGSWALILVVLGLIIGLLNIGGAELKEFLMAGTALVILSWLGGSTLQAVTISGTAYLKLILDALIVLFVPATIVVALKAVFAIAKK